VTALASYVEAKRHRGQWLVRIEDVDHTRTIPGMADHHLRQLEEFGFQWDGEVVWQSQRSSLYEAAIKKLPTYACNCSRSQLREYFARANNNSGHELVYPKFCRSKNLGFNQTAIRLKLPTSGDPEFSALRQFSRFVDGWQGEQCFDLETTCGDFVLKRADGAYSYQLAVVVDDAAQGITHVVRGADLLDNTPRQRWLNNCLGFTQPQYSHLPLVLAADGLKLSKQNGAQRLLTQHAVDHLVTAAMHLKYWRAEFEKPTSVREFWRLLLT
jgi:glutamyl-Q tRNA(Asp) synthetase